MKYFFPTLIAILLIAVAIGMHDQNGITGSAIASTGPGCCLNSCTNTPQDECPDGQFLPGESCRQVRECNIGCCQDTEGYCYSNYVRNICESEGAKFIGARGCPEFQECSIAPTEPADPQGYAYINNEGVIGLTINPPAGLKDEQFTLTAFTFKDQSNVKIRINDSNTITTLMALDGAPGDAQLGDNGYTATFDSSQIPQTTTIQTLTAQALLNDIPTGPQFPFFVSPNGCLPLFDHTYNESKQTIIFTRDPTLNFIDIQARSQTIASNLIRNVSSIFTDYNLYYHKNPTNTPKATCPQLNNDNRITVHMSLSYSQCNQFDDLIRTPNDIFRETDRPITSTNFTQNFCSYVTSPLEQQAAIYESLLDPEVEILSLPNISTVNTPTHDLRFKVNDNNKNASFRYRLMYNENANEIGWGYGIVGEEITHQIPIQDGLNAIIIKVEDIKANPGGNYSLIISNQSNFFLQSTLSDGQSFINEINFEVSYTHTSSPNVSFQVFDKHVQVAQGIIQNDSTSNVRLKLSPGAHDIRVVAYDGQERRASIPSQRVALFPVQQIQQTPVTNALPTQNLVTANAVYSPYSSTPVENEEATIENGVTGPDGYIHYPISLEGLYEPQQLCGLPDSEPGIKYTPIDCINQNFKTDFDIQTTTKEYGPDYNEYGFSYDVTTCSPGTLVDIYLQTCLGSSPAHPAEIAAAGEDGCYEERIERITLDEGYSLKESLQYKTAGRFNDLCIMVSDTDIEKQVPYCIPFKTPQCSDGLDNDNDRTCDFEGCGNLPADPGCSSENDVDESDGSPQCSDGIDNDDDGTCDFAGCNGLPADQACLAGATPLPAHNNEASETTQCQDGKDNDDDGTCDYDGCTIDSVTLPKDPGCSSANQNNEASATTKCQDKIDNDNDGTCDFGGCMNIFLEWIPADIGCLGNRTMNTEVENFEVCEISNTPQFFVTGTALDTLDEWKYQFSYDFYSCGENSEVTFTLEKPGTSLEIDYQVLFNGESHSDQKRYEDERQFTHICARASDSDFGKKCIELQQI